MKLRDCFLVERPDILFLKNELNVNSTHFDMKNGFQKIDHIIVFSIVTHVSFQVSRSQLDCQNSTKDFISTKTSNIFTV